MARRRSPHVDLTLLLVVAPFFAACDRAGAEERHCVDAGGVYVDDRRCDPANESYTPGFHYVYVPHRYYGGSGHSAGAFSRATMPGSGHAMASVARGGFGATGAGHGAAGG
jgi:hypothetical protein